MKKIALTQGKIALIDDADFELVSRFKWHAFQRGKTWYAERRVDDHYSSYMHRLILDAPAGVEVDHVNHDGLDNRRENLRLATRQQNSANRGPQRNNTSGFKGVCWYKKNRKWRAGIWVAGRNIHLGYFDTPAEASAAYLAAAKEYFGEFGDIHGT